jgi:hypothetical protein
MMDLPATLTRLSANDCGEHYFVSADCELYYFAPFIPTRPHFNEPPNNFIGNFKKSVERRMRPEYRYKEQAIRLAAQRLAGAVPVDWERGRGAIFVPVPPSSAPNDPLHDDRVMQVLTMASLARNIDVRELVTQRQSLPPSHGSEQRASVDLLVSNYRVDEAPIEPPPSTLIIVDDVLTTGRHFRAVQRVLSARYPRARIVGLFLLRRTFEAET